MVDRVRFCVIKFSDYLEKNIAASNIRRLENLGRANEQSYEKANRYEITRYIDFIDSD